MPTSTVTLMVKCAWCGEIQDEPQRCFITHSWQSHQQESMVTHTICPACKAEQFRLLEEFKPSQP